MRRKVAAIAASAFKSFKIKNDWKNSVRVEECFEDPSILQAVSGTYFLENKAEDMENLCATTCRKKASEAKGRCIFPFEASSNVIKEVVWDDDDDSEAGTTSFFTAASSNKYSL
mmetsp:Transcript_35901/g.57675  ORF Transcript_35901/g.57675 Transcript_35901/m.57675 type:complete len:114 (+) Transcript_35901:877-1218(+)